MSDKLRAARRELAVLLCRRECPALCQDGCSPGSRMFELADDILALIARHLGAGGAWQDEPPPDAMFIYAVPKGGGKWGLGLAYRTVSGGISQVYAQSSHPFDATKFAPLPPPPEVKE